MARMATRYAILPVEPPKELSDNSKFHLKLFELCRKDDYAGLYEEFIKKYGRISEIRTLP
jgi:hypothetical protein